MSGHEVMMPKRVKGLLVSQVGYEQGALKRALRRSTARDAHLDDAAWQIYREAGGPPIDEGRLRYWGACWGSHWWVADFDEVTETGSFRLKVKGEPPSDVFDVGDDLLWERCFDWMALSQLERRQELTERKLGWMDAGGTWTESNSQSVTVIALLELLEDTPNGLDEATRRRLGEQVDNGLGYLALCQDTAVERGEGDGALCHMITRKMPDYVDRCIAPDAAKAAVAWAMDARLRGDRVDVREDTLARAERALRWCLSMEPEGRLGFNHHQRGLPESYEPPAGQWPTRELLMRAWACVELAGAERPGYAAQASELIDAALGRQADVSEAIDGLHGFFFEFDDRHHAEPSWAHQIVDGVIGIDAGATYPQWVDPIARFIKAWPDHPRTPVYLDALRRYTLGYLKPACERNPFGLAPQLLHREHGLLNFVGPWHGMNCIYGLTARLLLELEDLLKVDGLRKLAMGNLQWIAGLNAGLTPEGLAGCFLSSPDTVPGVALPVSMIHGVGRRWAGGWTTIRGSVCNGFAVGRQFHFDVPVDAAVDGPHQFTDEDWLPHAVAFLTGLSRWRVR
ncbi:MAG: cellulase N-terminal Ig-like domain-containing protein [Planctomycetota bacterium]